ncbi:SufB/SufD family protein [Flavisphingomonas formosensis]|uniref:SufB/SufD family protein n=1 Tax=Flavisphingomonas formosensis TaxID=861534 RepID=UPI0012F9BF67|nr:SufD family Fe-S cluster assembly protein [Sphingomonas formosensis]
MTLALPSTRQEAWRWSDLSALPTLAEQAPRGGVIDAHDFWIGDGPRLLFIDGHYDAGLSRPGPVEIGRTGDASDHPLARLAGGDGWVLTLGHDHAPSGTIEIVHVATGGASHLPARITLAEDAQASIVETFVGDGWANRFTRIALARSARLMRTVRLLQSSGFQSIREEAAIAEGASLVTILLGAGAAGTRIDAALSLDGEGAFAEFGGALLARGDQRHDANIVLRHAAPGGSSRQIWRAVADDSATDSIAARVEVARGAQQTDAEQSLKGLLLARTATINTKPELEIFADDVKCAHGCAIGELDKQALFYMQSRGIPPHPARALLTRSFVAGALERIGEEAVRDAVLADAEAWLGEAA